MREVREFVVLVLVVVVTLLVANIAAGGELPQRVANVYGVVFDTLAPDDGPVS